MRGDGREAGSTGRPRVLRVICGQGTHLLARDYGNSYPGCTLHHGHRRAAKWAKTIGHRCPRVTRHHLLNDEKL